jgi:two-component system LytT family response regulator
MGRQFKALIVDDERLARQDLLSLLEQHDNIRVVGQADSVPTALDQLHRLKPDLIFLDIQMPGESGFDLLEKESVEAQIIFVTAYDDYAIRAFEVNALDYLLKPVNPERLARAIARLGTSRRSLSKDKWRKLAYDDRLFLMLGQNIRFLKVSTVLCVSAAGDYSEVKTTEGESGLTMKSMKEWEYRLPEQYFCRIHRSTIINMEYVEKIEEWFNYSFRVHIEGVEEPFIMSRRYAMKLKEKLG